MYIARDKDGTLNLFENKPTQTHEVYFDSEEDFWDGCLVGEITDKNIFKNLKWDNEPIKVQFLIDGTINKVFLGGTCNNSKWREELIPMLKCDYFNPVVEDWTPECQAEEERQKNEICNIHLYVITPKIVGYFSIAEIIESTHNKNVKTVICILPKDEDDSFTVAQHKSLDAVAKLAEQNGAIVCKDLKEVSKVLNE